jgi:hypothetical protein
MLLTSFRKQTELHEHATITLTSAYVTSSGSGYAVGDELSIPICDIDHPDSTAQVLVSRISDEGGIISLSVRNGGRCQCPGGSLCGVKTVDVGASSSTSANADGMATFDLVIAAGPEIDRDEVFGEVVSADSTNENALRLVTPEALGDVQAEIVTATGGPANEASSEAAHEAGLAVLLQGGNVADLSNEVGMAVAKNGGDLDTVEEVTATVARQAGMGESEVLVATTGALGAYESYLPAYSDDDNGDGSGSGSGSGSGDLNFDGVRAQVTQLGKCSRSFLLGEKILFG